jgi:hypothetical protein
VLLSFGVLFLHFAGLVFGVVTSFLCGFAADIFLSFLLVFFLLCLGAGSGLILNMLALVKQHLAYSSLIGVAWYHRHLEELFLLVMLYSVVGTLIILH